MSLPEIDDNKDMKQVGLLCERVGIFVKEIAEDGNGTVVDDYLLAFDGSIEALICALKLQSTISRYNQHFPELKINITGYGLSQG